MPDARRRRAHWEAKKEGRKEEEKEGGVKNGQPRSVAATIDGLLGTDTLRGVRLKM